jgi:putative transposase
VTQQAESDSITVLNISVKNWQIEQIRITLLFIQSGNPQQKAYIERINRTARYDSLSHYIYTHIEEMQDRATTWLWTYNNERPKGIGGITTIQKRRLTKSINSTPELD